ncbi:DNA polymerase Y family protein [Pseudoramibacter sp.]|uniref:DNA polymerase Y family protein n=1 Tax=Pseudoramibacter sp. TaxID=2034862 RepID=UPI0025DEE096|nr:DNA polymerase IV [Pseudoramibacter sp.]MCH4072597.1 DNA polymerase IV [Pseudoramibacter sp.]MCH4106368.1 DNA polymerase IV [Pseudoramibacter sp.]
MKDERVIFHVDVNSAFLSWTSVERLAHGESDLREIPAVIGGDVKKRHGVVLAKSIPAKAFGIHTGEPLTDAVRKCPDLISVPPDFQVYQRNSRAFKAICREYATAVQDFSIDECFLDVTQTTAFDHPLAAANEIKSRIKNELGFTVNVGIGPNKLLAKMAGDFEKPDKIHTLWRREIPAKMWPLDVGRLLSVGKKTSQKLNACGIWKIGDLAHCNLQGLKKIFGERQGAHLYAYANGWDDSPVLAAPREEKGYSVSITLPKNAETESEAKSVIKKLVDTVAMRLRSRKKRARRISVQIRYASFKDRSHQITLEEATDITKTIERAAYQLFDELWDQKTPLRLIGVSLSQIEGHAASQISMFDRGTNERERQIDAAIDAIRKRYGMDIINRGVADEKLPQVGRKYRAHFEIDRKK